MDNYTVIVAVVGSDGYIAYISGFPTEFQEYGQTPMLARKNLHDFICEFYPKIFTLVDFHLGEATHV